jgi:AcrR family transcriptional regulator
MSRLAKGRTTQLTRGEIARAALDHFDTSDRPLSMRALAASLGVAPPSLYHYFENEGAIVRGAVRLVFEETVREFLTATPDFGSADLEPTDLLLRSALSLRRAFLRHFRIARYITINPQPSERVSGLVAILGAAFEQLGLTGEKAGVAVFAYGHFVYGSILVSVSSQMADERFNAHRGNFHVGESMPVDAPAISPETLDSLDEVLNNPSPASDNDEGRFVAALRILIAGLVADAAITV